jgi:hypothetical protein
MLGRTAVETNHVKAEGKGQLGGYPEAGVRGQSWPLALLGCKWIEESSEPPQTLWHYIESYWALIGVSARALLDQWFARGRSTGGRSLDGRPAQRTL